jgi:hypothetical protein
MAINKTRRVKERRIGRISKTTISRIIRRIRTRRARRIIIRTPKIRKRLRSSWTMMNVTSLSLTLM